jgi:tetratricopeptide (TPR) repeat protein
MIIYYQPINLHDLDCFQKSCSVYDFYVNKIKIFHEKWGQMSYISYISALSVEFYSLFTSKGEAAAQELAYFNAQINNCDDGKKAIYHLVRGVAASNCHQNIAALTDYNYAISLLPKTPGTPEHLFAIQVAYYNRGYEFLQLKQYDKAFCDFENLNTLLCKEPTPHFEKYVTDQSCKLNQLKQSCVLALIGKYLMEDNFSSARQLFIGSNFSEIGICRLVLEMMLEKSLIGTCSLIFSNFEHHKVMRTILSSLLDSHQGINPAESHLNIAGIRSFYKAMTSIISNDHCSENYIDLPAELEDLDQVTIAAIQNGLNEMGTNYFLTTKFSSNNISNYPKVTSKKTTRKKERGLVISEITEDDKILPPRP